MAFPAINPAAPHLVVDRKPRTLYKRVAFTLIGNGSEAIPVFTLPDNTVILDAWILSRVPGTGGVQTVSLRIQGGATFMAGTADNAQTASPNGRDRGTFTPQPRTDGQVTIEANMVASGGPTTAPEVMVCLRVFRPAYPFDGAAGGGAASTLEHVRALTDPRMEIGREPVWIVREAVFSGTGAGTETLDLFDLPEATIVLDAHVLCMAAGTGGTSQTGSLKIQGGATFLTGTTNNLGAVGRQIAANAAFVAPQEPFATTGGNTAGTRTRVQMDNVRVGATATAPTAIVALLVMRQNIGSVRLADVRARERDLFRAGGRQQPAQDVGAEPRWVTIDADWVDKLTGTAAVSRTAFRLVKDAIILDGLMQITRAPVGTMTASGYSAGWEQGDFNAWNSLTSPNRTLGGFDRGTMLTVDVGNGTCTDEAHRDDDVNEPDVAAAYGGSASGADTAGPAARIALLIVRPSYPHQGMARPSI